MAYPNREELTVWWVNIHGGENVKMNFTSLFNHGTFDKFPDLKVVILEAGIGWLVWWLDRLDEKFEVNGFTTPMQEVPSTYFKRQGFISMDPDERLAKFSIEVLRGRQVHVGLRFSALGLDSRPGEGVGGESGGLVGGGPAEGVWGECGGAV